MLAVKNVSEIHLTTGKNRLFYLPFMFHPFSFLQKSRYHFILEMLLVLLIIVSILNKYQFVFKNDIVYDFVRVFLRNL